MQHNSGYTEHMRARKLSPSPGLPLYSDSNERKELDSNGKELREPRLNEKYSYHDHVYSRSDQAFAKLGKGKADRDRLKKRNDLIIAGIITFWASFVRFWKIWQPSSVVFDEVHFGGFAAKYIRTRFFFDVHPPLAKMLIALVAKLAGFKGDFDFKDIGLDYIEPGVPYISMRTFCAFAGLVVVPTAYLTIRVSGHSIPAAILAAMFVAYENGLITNNRLILLDPILLMFTALTILMWCNWFNQHHQPFKFWWWTWLGMTGLGLGLTVSCKWVGLFTIATIGFSTIKNLWEIWGDLRVGVPLFLQHFYARAVCLIILPMIIYMLMFQIHFHSLPNSGDGDGFMSTEFQQSLAGHRMDDTPADIAYGSRITIRHLDSNGGYLHSHAHDYPGGSKQQQVTLYPHKDENNIWLIKKADINPSDSDPIEYVRAGDIVRLEHTSTSKHLHSHAIRPIMSDLEYHNEVSAYGFEGFDGDANDYWRVEIASHDKKDPVATERLRTLHSEIRFVHVQTGCYLFSKGSKLPAWGFEQSEVTCISGGKLPKTTWRVETNTNEKLPEDAEKVNYRKLWFIGKFVELNKVMWRSNAGLTQSHPYDSRPQHWPYLRRGINMWGKDHLQVYLLGNPFIWWLSSAAILIYLVAKLLLILRAKRGYTDHFGGLRRFYDESAGFMVAAWALHYFPFFLMARQLFLHHYMPALYFSILTFAIFFDLVTIRLNNWRRFVAVFIMIVIGIHYFRVFAPLTYGSPQTKQHCEATKYLDTWDFDCVTFYDDLKLYYPSKIAEPPKEPVIEKDPILEQIANKEAPEKGTTQDAVVGELDAEEADNINIATEQAPPPLEQDNRDDQNADRDRLL